MRSPRSKSRHWQHQKRKDNIEEFRQIPRNKSHKSRRLQHRRNGRDSDIAALYGDEWTVTVYHQLHANTCPITRQLHFRAYCQGYIS